MQKLTILILMITIGLLMKETEAEERNIFVTAHRGASGLAPENTLVAVKKAIELGADYCEIDVQETFDGKIILLHDDDLKRTTGLKKFIWETGFEELKTLDAGSWFGNEFAGEPIPTLKSVIDLVKGKMKLNIELKTNGHQVALAKRVVKILEVEKMEQNCVVTSFDFTEVEKIHSLNPQIKTGYIFSNLPEIDLFKAPGDILSVHIKLINRAFVEKAHGADKEVHVWTVNKPSDMQRLIQLNVDNIITNYPNILVSLLENR